MLLHQRDYSQHKFDQRTRCRGPGERPERPERPETMLWTWWCEPLHSKRLLGQSPASMHWTKNWTSASLPQHVSNILLKSCAVWWSMYVFAWAFSSMRRKLSNCLLGELFNGAWDETTELAALLGPFLLGNQTGEAQILAKDDTGALGISVEVRHAMKAVDLSISVYRYVMCCAQSRALPCPVLVYASVYSSPLLFLSSLAPYK